MQEIYATSGDKTLIIVSHWHGFVFNFGKVYLLDEGKIIDEGKYVDLKNRHSF